MLIIEACNLQHADISNLPNRVKLALEKAGSNKSELLNVLEHYSKSSQDSLKLKAAFFLVANMDQWHYYDGEEISNYLDCFMSFRNELEGRRVNRSKLDSSCGPFFYNKLKLKYDIRVVKSSQLIGNIDMAFQVWQGQPWGKDYSFAQFCEYILPFRLGDEIPEYNRKKIYSQFNGLLDSVRKKQGNAVGACTAINNALQKEGWHLIIGTDFLPHFPASKLIEYRGGSCRDQSELGIYIMRSVGIPVCIDFIPQWPTRSLSHDFNAVIDKNGKPHLFGAADENPGVSKLIYTKKGKVFRRVFAQNMQSLPCKKNNHEIVPDILNNPYLKDVTDEYVPCSDITVPLIKQNPSKRHYEHAYICLFDNRDWIPVHWGNVDEDTVIFTKMESDIVYLPAYYDIYGIIPANYPFILKKSGHLEFLIPDTTHLLKSITVTRIFPTIPHRLRRIDGYFQGSNTPNFAKSTELLDLSHIDEPPKFWNAAHIKTDSNFRYVRYYKPWQCDIGEIEFYHSKKKISGKVLCSGASLTNDSLFSAENAVDGDLATSYISYGNAPAWVGLDLGKPQKIDSIRFSPGISIFGPRCFVTKGHKYELRFWVRGQWKVVEASIAKNNSVTFKNIPSNALYLVHDLTEKVDERFFTIENGRQIWW